MADKAQAVTGRQRSVLDHLTACGGMTMPALGVILGTQTRSTLRRMLSQGLVKTSVADGVRLFLAANTPRPATEELFKRRLALGWLYARALQADCAWIAGLFPEVIFPAGNKFQVAWRGRAGEERRPVLALIPDDQAEWPTLPADSFIIYSSSLREKILSEALKWVHDNFVSK